jgi:hypothetical protein
MIIGAPAEMPEKLVSDNLAGTLVAGKTVTTEAFSPASTQTCGSIFCPGGNLC